MCSYIFEARVDGSEQIHIVMMPFILFCIRGSGLLLVDWDYKLISAHLMEEIILKSLCSTLEQLWITILFFFLWPD
jgi:hypothetical protein